MTALTNGQCAHRWSGFGRCLDLATTTRPMILIVKWAMESGEVIYDIALCADHAGWHDRSNPVRMN